MPEEAGFLPGGLVRAVLVGCLDIVVLMLLWHRILRRGDVAVGRSTSRNRERGPLQLVVAKKTHMRATIAQTVSYRHCFYIVLRSSH